MKKTLFIDTTDRSRILLRLIVDDQTYTKEESSIKNKNQELLPFIIALLNEHQLTVNDLTKIEVNPGPGSFTGIRVGISVAQALGHSLNIPVIGVEPNYSV